jgi:DNA-binding CsgD family transcriptional regulator
LLAARKGKPRKERQAPKERIVRQKYSFLNGIEGKVCGHCKVWKPLAEYYKSAAYGEQGLCKKCKQTLSRDPERQPKLRAQKLDWYYRHHAEELARRAKYRKDRAREREVLTDDLQEHFWQKVHKGSVDECWEWQGYVGPNGYGQIGHKRGIMTAHRVSWLIHHGPIPEGMMVLHKCDNRKCVNPDHLYLGTASDNMRDAYTRGRMPDRKGENASAHKLTEAQVLEIRTLWARGEMSRKELAAKFGISPITVGEIIRRITWKHI